MVAYDAGEYRSIGSNIEFGGLVDGPDPSVKKELMSRILGFFGDIITGEEEISARSFDSSVEVYPNPFSGEVNFSFNLKEKSSIKIEIFDMTGRKVGCAAEGYFNAGTHTVTWSLSSTEKNQNGGIYFYRIISGTEIQGGKLLLTE
jgi:hypothetical protein